MLYKFATMMYCLHDITALMMIPPTSQNINHRHRYHHHLYQKKHHNILSSTSHHADQDWSVNAIEEARQQFEDIIGPMIFDDNCNNQMIVTNDGSLQTTTRKKPHLLTNAQRKRRQIEIQLLQSLLYSDDAIDEIMSLWIHECPSQIVNTDTMQFMSSSDASCTLQEAEGTLRNILQHCPISIWPEPAARFAYVLYAQERYIECESYVRAVLSVKPWHFEMIQLQVLLELSEHNHDSMSNAIRIARRNGLPPLGQTKRRYKWVQNAVRQAQDQLQQLEYYTANELQPDLYNSASTTLTWQ